MCMGMNDAGDNSIASALDILPMTIAIDGIDPMFARSRNEIFVIACRALTTLFSRSFCHYHISLTQLLIVVCVSCVCGEH